MLPVPTHEEIKLVLQSKAEEAWELSRSLRQVFHVAPLAMEWLYKPNSHLGGELPAALIVAGRISEVQHALDDEYVA